MNKQLIFKFPKIKNYFKEDFYVSSSNEEAFELIDKWPKWIKNFVNIYGPSGCGKSHLITILTTKTSSIIVKPKDLNDDVFYKIKPKEAIILEDFDKSVPEKILYSFLNVLEQDNKYLVITSRKPLSEIKFKSPDLTSRINSLLNIKIQLPNDDLVKVILSKNFSDKQIVIDKKLIDYIIKHIERSYEEVAKFISIIDRNSLKKGVPINLKTVKETLRLLKN